jgi:hypothetical protein
MAPPRIAQGFTVMWRAFVVLLQACGAVVALWPGVSDLNPAFRGGIAAFFAGKAVASALLLVARLRFGDVDPDRLVRSFIVQSYGYVAAGILVGAGALSYGGIKGFLGAYAAFSFAWVWFWIRGRLSAARSEV